MPISAHDLRVHIIRPALYEIDSYSKNAEEVLIAIAAHESHLGTNLAQRKGPALGIYQMEPATFDDVIGDISYITKGRFASIIGQLELPKAERMVYDLRFATKMARLFLLRIEEPLPESNDIKGIANYWKKYWNTVLGKGTVDVFIKDYKRLVERTES